MAMQLYSENATAIWPSSLVNTSDITPTNINSSNAQSLQTNVTNSLSWPVQSSANDTSSLLQWMASMTPTVSQSTELNVSGSLLPSLASTTPTPFLFSTNAATFLPSPPSSAMSTMQSSTNVSITMRSSSVNILSTTSQSSTNETQYSPLSVEIMPSTSGQASTYDPISSLILTVNTTPAATLQSSAHGTASLLSSLVSTAPTSMPVNTSWSTFLQPLIVSTMPATLSYGNGTSFLTLLVNTTHTPVLSSTNATPTLYLFSSSASTTPNFAQSGQSTANSTISFHSFLASTAQTPVQSSNSSSNGTVSIQSTSASAMQSLMQFGINGTTFMLSSTAGAITTSRTNGTTSGQSNSDNANTTHAQHTINTDSTMSMHFISESIPSAPMQSSTSGFPDETATVQSNSAYTMLTTIQSANSNVSVQYITTPTLNVSEQYGTASTTSLPATYSDTGWTWMSMQNSTGSAATVPIQYNTNETTDAIQTPMQTANGSPSVHFIVNKTISTPVHSRTDITDSVQSYPEMPLSGSNSSSSTQYSAQGTVLTQSQVGTNSTNVSFIADRRTSDTATTIYNGSVSIRPGTVSATSTIVIRTEGTTSLPAQSNTTSTTSLYGVIRTPTAETKSNTSTTSIQSVSTETGANNTSTTSIQSVSIETGANNTATLKAGLQFSAVSTTTATPANSTTSTESNTANMTPTPIQSSLMSAVSMESNTTSTNMILWKASTNSTSRMTPAHFQFGMNFTADNSTSKLPSPLQTSTNSWLPLQSSAGTILSPSQFLVNGTKSMPPSIDRTQTVLTALQFTTDEDAIELKVTTSFNNSASLHPNEKVDSNHSTNLPRTNSTGSMPFSTGTTPMQLQFSISNDSDVNESTQSSIANPIFLSTTTTAQMHSKSNTGSSTLLFNTTSAKCNSTTNTVCIPLSSSQQLCVQGEYELVDRTSQQESSQPCVKCGPGAYSTALGAKQSGSCSKCPSGTYQSGQGMVDVSNCTLCISGTFQPYEGMVSHKNCTQCRAGTYQTGLGIATSMNCTPCEVGKYQTGFGMTESQNCTNCPAGKYHFMIGADSASACKNFGTPSSDIHLTFSEVELPSGHYSAQLTWTAPSNSGYKISLCTKT